MDVFGEDWNASQFWYTEQTATTLAEQLLDGADSTSNIAIVSAPSAYVALKNLLQKDDRYKDISPRIALLEYDDRFAVFKNDFVPYDFAQPFKLPNTLKASFDRIVCDPPFLNQDCQTKAAMTVRWLTDPKRDLRLIVCTGERMETLVHKLYGKTGLGTTTFYPEHSKGLSNEFRCYANFDCDRWRRQDAVPEAKSA